MLKNFLLGIAFCAVMALAVTGFAQTFTNADLAGAYAAGSLSLENFEAADGEAYINVFSVTFDGAGSWSGTHTDFSSSGGSGAGAISGTYAVNADGSFDWVITSFVPNETYTGHISSSGDVLILSGGETVGVDIRQNIGVAVKKQGTFTNADLAGAYAARSLSLENFEAADGEAYINVFSVTFDGAGSWSGTYTDFSSSGGSGAGAISGTYAVNADGSFDWVITSFVPNETYTGHISSSGDVLILSEGETVGVDIRQNIGVAVKKQEDGDSVNTISGGGGEG